MPLYDAHGRLLPAPRPAAPMRRVVSRTYYDGGGTAPRRFTGVLTSNASGTVAALANASTLRARAHDVIRNNPWAWHGVEMRVANYIGTGIKPQSLAPDPAIKEQLHMLWKDWTDESDADGVTDFYGQQTLMCFALFESGECFARLRPRRLEDGLTVPLQLQLLEADHVPLHENRMQGQNRVRAGIEFSPFGRREAYWMYREHPGDQALFAPDTQAVRVAASDVLHCYQPTRPGQLRGVTHLARTLLRLIDIDEGDDAELMKKKIQSLFAGFVVTPEQARLFDEPEATTESDEALAPLEAGIIQYLRPGESIEFGAPPSIPSNHADFMKYHLHGVAAGHGVTYEQLTGDLSEVNFSSIRAGLNEFYRQAEPFIHQILVYQFCRPVWQRFVTEAVLSGAVRIPAFATNPKPWLRCDWIPQGWAYVNPVDEVTANKTRYDLGMTTLSRLIQNEGNDPEVIFRERAEEEAFLRSLGLRFGEPANATEQPDTP